MLGGIHSVCTVYRREAVANEFPRLSCSSDMNGGDGDGGEDGDGDGRLQRGVMRSAPGCADTSICMYIYVCRSVCM